MMRRLVLSLVVCGAGAWAGASAGAQTHKVTNPGSVVRAVGVYEWTGDMAKPAASRLIPVTLFLEGELRDAGVYMARPVPFALNSGNVYELQDAGVAKGSLELVYAKHLQGVSAATGESLFDDGWFGYGSYKAPAPPKKITPLKASKTQPVIVGSQDSGRPHFSNKSADTAAAGADGKPSVDPAAERASGTVDTDPSKSSGDAKDAGNAPAGDPERPTMKRRTTGETADTSSKKRDDRASVTGVSTDDPDRPTLKKRPAEKSDDGTRTGAPEDDVASVGANGALNDDPNRPNLHRGKPVNAMKEDDLPKLTGIPKDADLHQMVAVSDAANRETHEFARAWTDDAERAAVLLTMETMTRAQLAGYGVPAAAPAPTKKAAAPMTAAAKTRAKREAAKNAAVPVALLDEELKGYTLSYGGAPTYVFTAHTAGEGAALKYVTVVAQDNGLGDIKAALQSVTDAVHLDRTPRMRFVDAVDVDAGNRASLLLELRGKSSRQFALYRVIAAKADQLFVTGSTQ